MTRSEIDQFYREGFVIKSLNLNATCRERALDLVWTKLPTSFRRDDPNSWHGIVADSCHELDLVARRGRLKFRECLRSEPWLFDMLAGNKDVLGMIEQFLGKDQVLRPKYFRGIYPIFPCGLAGKKQVNPHIDGHAFQVGGVLYLDDVAPSGGGLHVWPGSHLPMMEQQRTHHGRRIHSEGLDQLLSRYKRNASPLEIHGPAGTLILWHQRLVHGAGLNATTRVRQAMFCDFGRNTLANFQDEPLEGDPWKYWNRLGGP